MVLVDRSNRVLITSAVFLGLATVFVALRCISKFAIRRRADVDDWVTILAWVSIPFYAPIASPLASHVHPPPIPTISDRTICNHWRLLCRLCAHSIGDKGVTSSRPPAVIPCCLENASPRRRS